RFVDRGDGILALVHPVDNAPRTLLLGTVIPLLGRMLRDHNMRCPNRALRMRAVLHAGEVHYDSQGCYGEAIHLALRLVDAATVKRHLEMSVSPLVLVVSDLIFQTVVRHGYQHINDLDFTTTVDIQMAGRTHRGYLQRTRQVPVVSPNDWATDEEAAYSVSS